MAHDMNLVLEEANERLKVPLRKVAMGLVAPRVRTGGTCAGFQSKGADCAC